MLTEAKPYPFDVHALSKGDYITPAECERVSGVKRDDMKRYPLRLLGLKEALERQWYRERGETITTAVDHDGIRICTDDDAVVTNEQRAQQAKGALRRALVRQNGVDVTKLSGDDVKDKHRSSLTRLAAFIAGGTREVQATLKGHARATPGLKE
jgi:hypothetical protein